jgi:hypothetical protein
MNVAYMTLNAPNGTFIAFPTLAAILESHFSYEERKIAAAIDGRDWGPEPDFLAIATREP